MNNYIKMEKRHQKDFENFPKFFAFGNEQFNKGMEKLELDPKDEDKIFTLYGAGDYYRKADKEKLLAMLEDHNKEFKEAIQADKTGEGFIFKMFSYELKNHEYNYTESVLDTLDALNLTLEEINNNPNLKHGLDLAKKAQSEQAFK